MIMDEYILKFPTDIEWISSNFVGPLPDASIRFEFHVESDDTEFKIYGGALAGGMTHNV
jgi:hypothetical protein